MDVFPERIETDSLVLERLCERRVDPAELYDLFGRGEDLDAVFEYVPQEPHGSIRDARALLADAEDDWDDAESAVYGVRAPGGDLAGVTALSVDWDRRTGHLGAILGKPFWGRGYAGECATALAELAFERLDLDLVAIGHEEGNERSRGAVESFVEAVGGDREATLRNDTPIGDAVADHHRYAVSAEQFRRATGERPDAR